LSAGSVSTDGSGVTNVLMVTTTMRMLDGVHGNTSNSGPVSLLGVSLEVGVVGLQEGLVSSLTTGNDTDHTSAGTLDGFSNTRRHSDSGLLEVFGVTDDNARVSGGTGNATTVTELSLNVGDDSTFGHGVHGEDIADGEGGFGASVDKLSSVDALDSDEILSALLVFILVSENNFGEGCTSTGVVHDVLNESLDVAGSLGEIEGSETCRSNSLRGVGLEDGGSSSSLGSDDSSHD